MTEPTRRSRAFTLVAGLLLASVGLAACGGDDEPELTFEERLNLIEGRSLSPIEVAERASVGEALCRLDDELLDQIWQRLDDDQLEFQDAVVATLCPDRAILYAGHTGRKVTDEAVESGVETSTTRPPSTSTTVATTATTSRGLGGLGGPGGSTPTSSSTASSQPTSSTSTTVDDRTTTTSG